MGDISLYLGRWKPPAPELMRLLNSSSVNFLLNSHISRWLGNSVNKCHLHLPT